MTKIAFLGLGVMGYPMAGHLAAAGHEVTCLQPHRRKGRGVGGTTWRQDGLNPRKSSRRGQNGHGLCGQ